MEKAYDVSALTENLKGRGLDLAEDAAQIAVETVLDWLKESAELSENVYDDILVNVVPLFKAELDKRIDKIDGKEG